MEEEYGVTFCEEEIFPQMEVPVFYTHPFTEKIVGETMAWGFPGFKEKQFHINARGESIIQKPTFAKAFELHRGIVPASGFYEWQKEKGKIPLGTKFSFYEKEEPMYFAAVYQLRDDGKKAFAIITLAAQGEMKKVHHRMPLLLQKKEERKKYLTNVKEATKLLKEKPYSSFSIQLLEEVIFQEQIGFL